MEAFEKLSGEIDNEITSTTKANGESREGMILEVWGRSTPYIGDKLIPPLMTGILIMDI